MGVLLAHWRMRNCLLSWSLPPEVPLDEFWRQLELQAVFSHVTGLQQDCDHSSPLVSLRSLVHFNSLFKLLEILPRLPQTSLQLTM